MTTGTDSTKSIVFVCIIFRQKSNKRYLKTLVMKEIYVSERKP